MDVIFLALAGFAAGAINALAGGGTLFTFSALMFTGLPPVVANTTSAVAVLPGQIAAGLAYWSDIKAYWRQWLPLSVLSAIGGLIGGVALLNGGNDTFRFLVPFLVLLATVSFLFSAQIAAFGERLAEQKKGPGFAYGVHSLVSVYGGYFGAGMGIMMLASLPLTEGRDYHRVNAAKSLMATIMQGIAVVLFLIVGDIDYAAAAVVAAASITGGWLSIRIGKRIPTIWIRRFVILVGFSLSAWYFVA